MCMPLKPSIAEGLMMQCHKEDKSVSTFAGAEYTLSLDVFLLPFFHASKLAFLSHRKKLHLTCKQWLCFLLQRKTQQHEMQLQPRAQ